jgi:hypothetical protein
MKMTTRNGTRNSMMNACDVRADFERELLDWMEENAESNERIEVKK